MGLIHCNLRVLMAERGLNIQNVKDKTTLSRTTISNLYNNLGSGIQYGTLLELCELLNCTPGDLLSYVEIDTEFDVTQVKQPYNQSQDTYLFNDEGDGYEYISGVQVDLGMTCLLKYEGKKYDFSFKIYLELEINEKKEIHSINIAIAQDFRSEIEKILTPHATKFFFDNLSDFLIDWGHDEFYGNEIEGISQVSIYYGYLEEMQAE